MRTATHLEDSVSNASYLPESRGRNSKSGDMFRHEASDQKSIAQHTAKKQVTQDVKLSLVAPQANLMLFDRRPSFRVHQKGITDSVESISKSDRTMKQVKPLSELKQLNFNQGGNSLVARRSQAFSISASKPLQSPSKRELNMAVSKITPSNRVQTSIANRQPIRMFRKDQIDTDKVIEEAKSYFKTMEKAKKERFMYSENIDLKIVRTNVRDGRFSKFRTREILAKFQFEKKDRTIGNLKEKIGKNRKMIQYEAKVLKSTNTADINSFRKDLRLVIEEKYDFFVNLDKLKDTFKARSDQYIPSTYSSKIR